MLMGNMMNPEGKKGNSSTSQVPPSDYVPTLEKNKNTLSPKSMMNLQNLPHKLQKDQEALHKTQVLNSNCSTMASVSP
jgi:hypothetical protein